MADNNTTAIVPLLIGAVAVIGFGVAFGLMTSGSAPVEPTPAPAVEAAAAAQTDAGGDDGAWQIEEWTLEAKRRKGEGLVVDVFKGGVGQGDPLDPTDAVSKGDSLAFRVRNEKGGWFLLAGVNAKGETYPIHPADGAAMEITGSAEPIDLDTTVTLGEGAGVERVVSLRCSKSFSLEEIDKELLVIAAFTAQDQAMQFLRQGCAQDDLVLTKSDG